MSEKTQFTPEDVGRSFYTATEGVTATLLKLDPIYGYKFNYSNGNLIFLDNNGKRNDLDRKHHVFPSRPVESAPSQPTIDSEVEELARELFIHSDEVYYPDIAFKEAEAFIKFRNERRASHGKP